MYFSMNFFYIGEVYEPAKDVREQSTLRCLLPREAGFPITAAQVNDPTDFEPDGSHPDVKLSGGV
jgi:hypothetical protein